MAHQPGRHSNVALKDYSPRRMQSNVQNGGSFGLENTSNGLTEALQRPACNHGGFGQP